MSWAWWKAPVIPATWEAEAGPLELGGGGCSEPRSYHFSLRNTARLHLQKQNNQTGTSWTDDALMPGAGGVTDPPGGPGLRNLSGCRTFNAKTRTVLGKLGWLVIQGRLGASMKIAG